MAVRRNGSVIHIGRRALPSERPLGVVPQPQLPLAGLSSFSKRSDGHPHDYGLNENHVSHGGWAMVTIERSDDGPRSIAAAV
jgi:hypothetical protein